MRTKQKFIPIVVREKTYNKLLEDKKTFEEKFNCGKWSISDTIDKYVEMIEFAEEEERIVGYKIFKED